MNGKYESPLSPYKFAEKEGKRPQMIYNYIKNKMIKVDLTETGKMVIRPEEMNRWSKKWEDKRKETENA
jgi:hypothetical protein